MNYGIKLENYWEFKAYERLGGNLLWTRTIPNLLPTEALNNALTQIYKASAYTAAWYVGLVDDAGFTAFAAGDTAAQINGLNGWTESVDYDEAVRQTLTLGSVSAGSVDNSASLSTFTINATITLRGGFICTDSTKAGTSGVLGGEAAFNEGTQNLVAGNVITVGVTLTAASA